MSRDPQVIVAGGGPAGAAAALVLARRGRFLADAHLPCYGNVSVWGGDEPATTDFIFDPNGHGWRLDRARFDATLRDAARDAGTEALTTARLVGAVRDGAGWLVTLAADTGNKEELRCDWLIDATGRRAAVAWRAGARRLRNDFLVAFHARFRAPAGGDRDSRTMVESDPDGWWYTALVPSGERIVAFLTDADLVDRAALLSAVGFADRLNFSRYIRGALAAHGYELVGLPRGADASTARLDRVAGVSARRDGAQRPVLRAACRQKGADLEHSCAKGRRLRAKSRRRYTFAQKVCKRERFAPTVCATRLRAKRRLRRHLMYAAA